MPTRVLNETWEKTNGVNSQLISISKTGKTRERQPKQINMYCAYGQHASMRRSCKRICCQLILINGKKEETRCGPLLHSTRLWKIICAKYAVRLFGLISMEQIRRSLDEERCIRHCFKLPDERSEIFLKKQKLKCSFYFAAIVFFGFIAIKKLTKCTFKLEQRCSPFSNIRQKSDKKHFCLEAWNNTEEGSARFQQSSSNHTHLCVNYFCYITSDLQIWYNVIYKITKTILIQTAGESASEESGRPWP